jgi:hypothetical protein
MYVPEMCGSLIEYISLPRQQTPWLLSANAQIKLDQTASWLLALESQSFFLSQSLYSCFRCLAQFSSDYSKAGNFYERWRREKKTKFSAISHKNFQFLCVRFSPFLPFVNPTLLYFIGLCPGFALIN